VRPLALIDADAADYLTKPLRKELLLSMLVKTVATARRRVAVAGGALHSA